MSPDSFTLVDKRNSVRTQKRNCPQIKWHKADLVKALDRRIFIFSDEAVSSFGAFLASTVEDQVIDQVFDIANANPRDLWHVFDRKVSMEQVPCP